MGHLGGGFNEELVSGGGHDGGHDAGDPPDALAEPAQNGDTASSFSRGFWGSDREQGLFDSPARARRDVFAPGEPAATEPGGGRPPSLAAGSHLGAWPESGRVRAEASAVAGNGDPLERVGSRWWDEPARAAATSSGGPGAGGGAARGGTFFDNPPPASTASDSGFWGDAAPPGDEQLRSQSGPSSAISGPEADPDADPAYVSTGQRGRDDSGSTPLPHWTEPPSGEVPRILADDPAAPEADELNAWSSLSSGPRWRDQPNDWDESDFHEAIAEDDDTQVGALRGGPPPSAEEDLFAFEEAPAHRERAPRLPRPARSRAQTPEPDAPARYDVGAAVGPGRSQSSTDLPTRVITGLIAAGVALIAAVIGPNALVVLVTVAVTMAAAEMFQALRSRGYQPATLLGLAATASLMAGAAWRGEAAFALVLALYTVFCLLWYLAGVVTARPTLNIAVSLMTFLYVGFLGSFAVLLLKVPIVADNRLLPRDSGIGILLGAVIATAAYDIGAFFVGRSMGRTPLAPSISPNKTVEGTVGATLVTFLACIVIVGAIHPWDKGKAFWLALVVSAAAPLGDLCESMIKRDLGVKDMGTILPGHGGVLDRIDALLFVVPATWYLWHLF